MLSINPTVISRDKPYTREELMEVIRLAIIAEHDAINLYEQMARFIEDEDIKKVFLDIAREEKTHVGEFTALLLKLDEEQVEELKKGFEEVREMTGIETKLNDGGNDYFEVLKKAFMDGVERGRRIINILPKTKVHAQSYRVDLIESGEVVSVSKKEFREIPLITQRFSIGIRELKDGSFDPSVATRAGELIAKAEEKQILSRFDAGKKMELGDWETSDECIEQLMKAAGEVSKVTSGKLAMIISPERFSKLLKVHDKSGKTVIEVLKEVFSGGIIVSPEVEEKVIVFANTPSVLDVVIGHELELNEIGPENDSVVFMAMEALDLRLKDPKAVIVLEKSK